MTTAAAEYRNAPPIIGPWMITRPGLYDRMSDHAYHGDPVPAGSISHSMVKTLLTSCPARLAYDRVHGRPPKKEFDLGHVAHGEILGTGQPYAVREHPDGRTKAGKAEKEEFEAAGLIAITKDEQAAIRAMGDKIRGHDIAGPLFREGRGIAERVGVWFDEEFGIWRRMKVDWTTRDADGRLVFVDYKSARLASPGAISRSMWDFGYYTQDPFYTDGGALLYGEPVTFLFVFQEKTPPYFVTVAELTPEDRQWGRLKVRKGLETYVRCRERNEWPEYATDIVEVAIPAYARRELERAWESRELEVTL